MKKRHLINLIVLILILAFAAYNFYHRPQTLVKSRFLMDTLVEITAVSSDKDLDRTIDKTFSMIDEYDRKFSFYKENGDLWKINHSAADTFAIDEEFYQMLALGKHLYEMTDSLYDLSIGKLSDLWDFNKTHIPATDSIKIALKQLGFDKIKFTKI